jgi:hypothetical protein
LMILNRTLTGFFWAFANTKFNVVRNKSRSR